jgi:subtilase family serine protease
VKLYDNNTQTQKITLTELAAGESTTITFNWTPTTGNHTITVIADANKQITETNNQQVSTVSVA